jgi:N6-L-threonylcarbamoyladenine synthase
LYWARGLGDYRFVGGTRDDAAGEAFDKAAKMMGLGYPGGRIIDQLAQQGNPTAIRFPRAHLKNGKPGFSYSGLKTALRHFLQSDQATEHRREDIAASYQEAVVDMLIEPTLQAALELQLTRIVVSGGVSANSRLRQRMREEGEKRGIDVFVPSLKFCTDNAAMIAFAGAWRLANGQRASLDLNASATLRL